MTNKFIYVCVAVATLTLPLGAVSGTTHREEGCVLLMDGGGDPYNYSYSALVYCNGQWEVAFRYRYPCAAHDCWWDINLPAPREGEEWNIVGLSCYGRTTCLRYSDGKMYCASGTVVCIVDTLVSCIPPSGWTLVYDMNYTGVCSTWSWPVHGGDSLAAAVSEQIQSSALGNQISSKPNPFSISTMLHFNLESQDHVTAEIYNSMGQRVRTLLDAYMLPGEHSFFWDGRDDNGQQVASGVYFSRVTTGEGAQTQKMIRLQ